MFQTAVVTCRMMEEEASEQTHPTSEEIDHDTDNPIPEIGATSANQLGANKSSNHNDATLISKIVNAISDAVFAMGFNGNTSDRMNATNIVSRTRSMHMLDPNTPVIFLSIPYTSRSDPKFVQDFESRPWITYRHSFPPIQPTGYTSDVGWGCMLRSGQMMLANAFVYHYLGRGWRLSQLVRDRTSRGTLMNSSLSGSSTWTMYVNVGAT